jgi:hypothetical protein
MLLALHLRDIIDARMLAFTLTSAEMFLPTVLALYARRRDPSAAFWSKALVLSAVIFRYFTAEAGWGDVFDVTPLWVGLAFSFAVYGTLAPGSAKRR